VEAVGDLWQHAVIEVHTNDDVELYALHMLMFMMLVFLCRLV